MSSYDFLLPSVSLSVQLVPSCRKLSTQTKTNHAFVCSSPTLAPFAHQCQSLSFIILVYKPKSTVTRQPLTVSTNIFLYQPTSTSTDLRSYFTNPIHLYPPESTVIHPTCYNRIRDPNYLTKADRTTRINSS